MAPKKKWQPKKEKELVDINVGMPENMVAFAARQAAKRTNRDLEEKAKKQAYEEEKRLQKEREKTAKDKIAAIDIKFSELVKQVYQKKLRAGLIGVKVSNKQQANLYREAEIERKAMYKVEIAKLVEKGKVEELKRQEEIQELQADDEEKQTIRYFNYNQYEQKKFKEKVTPVYVGDFKMTEKSWVPHGKGKIQINNVVQMEGDFKQGFLTGKGMLRFLDGSRWEGGVRDNNMHGIGKYTDAPIKKKKERENSDDEDDSNMESEYETDTDSMYEGGNDLVGEPPRVREAIAKDNFILCFREQLLNGTTLEFQNIQNKTKIGTKIDFKIYEGEKRKMKAYIIGFGPIRDWIYKLRFYDEIYPRERAIDLSLHNDFKVVLSAPTVYSLQSYGIQATPDQIQDYRHLSKPPYEASSKYKKLEQRFEDIRLDNMFVFADEGEDDSTIATQFSQSTDLSSIAAFKNPSMSNIRHLARAACEPLTPLRHYTSKPANVFEALAAGIGAAKEEENTKAREKRKKEQFHKLIEERKAAAEARKQKEIEEQQAKIMGADLEEQKKVTQAKEAEEEAYRKVTEAAIEAELESLNSKDNASKGR